MLLLSVLESLAGEYSISQRSWMAGFQQTWQEFDGRSLICSQFNHSQSILNWSVYTLSFISSSSDGLVDRFWSKVSLLFFLFHPLKSNLARIYKNCENAFIPICHSTLRGVSQWASPPDRHYHPFCSSLNNVVLYFHRRRILCLANALGIDGVVRAIH